MNRILWALLITGVVLLLFIYSVQTLGAPIVIIVLIALFVLGLKIYNRRQVSGHKASGVDAANQPGRAVTVADRTSRWWDTERELEHGTHTDLLGKIIPFSEVRVGSLDASRRQQRLQAQGRPVRPLDWTAPNRRGGGMMGGGMTASGMTYDWCTCSEQAMPLITDPDGTKRVNRGEETCICLCSDCAPTGHYTDADGKRQPVKARHWRERDMEHEVRVSLVDSHRAAETGRWEHLREQLWLWWDDYRKDRRDRAAAKAAGWEHPHERRARGEEVITDTDEWYANNYPDDADDGAYGRHANTDDRPTDPDDMNRQPGGHE